MSLRGLDILLIEDDGGVQETMRALLEARGARVRVAPNGEAGLLALDEGCPDLILCDLVMPIVDGWEVARSVRQRPDCSHVRLIALTGLGETESYVRTWAVGFDAHLQKPLKLEELEAVAERLLVGSPKRTRQRKDL